MESQMQQHNSKFYCARSPPPPPPRSVGGVNRSIFNCFKTWSRCILNWMESQMQQHDSKYCARRLLPPPRSWRGVKRFKFNFYFKLKHSRIVYQIKWNHEWNNIVANRLTTDPNPPWSWGMGSKGQNSIFNNMVLFHIKSKGIRYIATW